MAKKNKNTTVVGTTLETTDYEQFKLLKDNRSSNKNHIKKLAKSVTTLGTNLQAIIVNSKMEVLDGSHRLQACKLAGVPVRYLVLDPLEYTNEEIMIELNINSKNWSLENYIEHYSHSKNEYKRLLYIENKYNIGYFSALAILGLNKTNIEEGIKFSIPTDFEVKIKDLINLRTTYKLWTGKVLRALPAAQGLRDIHAMIATKAKRGDTLAETFSIDRAIKNVPKIITPMGISDTKDTVSKMLSDAHDKGLRTDKRVYLV